MGVLLLLPFTSFNQLLSKALGRHAKKGVRLIGVGVGISPASGQIALPL